MEHVCPSPRHHDFVGHSGSIDLEDLEELEAEEEEEDVSGASGLAKGREGTQNHALAKLQASLRQCVCLRVFSVWQFQIIECVFSPNRDSVGV